MPTAPNVLLLLTDDQRFDTIAALGNQRAHTPHMDRLVAEGTTFTRCHIQGGTCGAVCMPSRATLHTGRGLFEIHEQGQRIADDQTMFGEHLAAHGWHCHHIGKWHNSPQSLNRAFQSGEEIFFGGMTDHWRVPAHRYDPTCTYAQPRARQGPHSTAIMTDATVNFIRNHSADVPFFCSVAFLAPHDPREMPEDYLTPHLDPLPEVPANFLPEHPFDIGDLRIRDEMLADLPRRPGQIQRHLAEYQAMIDHLDHGIGRILAELDQRGMADNTIVILGGDNGLAIGQHGLMGKQSCYDHSLRVPFIWRGPGVPVGEQRKQLVHLHDCFPTVCDLVGVPIPASVTAQSCAPTIRENASHRPELGCAYRQFVRSLTRDDGWKLIVTTPPMGGLVQQLFNITEDPGEIHDRSADPAHADILADCRARLVARSTIQADPWIRDGVLS